MSDHARTHIKAMIDTLKEERPEKLAQPAGLFISGMLTGLAASTHILNGSTAEAEMERVEVNLAAAIGNAYLNGTLPTTPPRDPADELKKVNALLQDLGVEGELGAHGMAALANTVRCMREELRHAELAIARVRLVKKAPGRSPHNLHVNAQDDGWDQALDAVHTALGSPARCETKSAGKDHPVHELLAALKDGVPHTDAVGLIGRYYDSIHELCCPYEHTELRPVCAEGAHQADDSDTTTPDIVHPTTEPQASNPQKVEAPCPQHPDAPVIGGLCGGCTQYPAGMKPSAPASEEPRDVQH